MVSTSRGRVLGWIAALSVFTDILLFTAAETVYVDPSRQRNVALNRPCTQSSVWTTYNGRCEGAVNGRKEEYLEHAGNSDCAHTSNNDLNPYLFVDLGPNVYIHKIVLTGRTQYEKRMRYIRVFLDNTLYSTLTAFQVVHTLLFDENDVRKVENITLRNTGTDADGVMINLCELEVFGCTNDRWGPTCRSLCHEGCLDLYFNCDRLTGDCIACKRNRWGRKCEYLCPAGCANRDVICDRNTSECTECRSDRWGGRCENLCPEGCLDRNVTCDRSTGECIGCKKNRWGRQRCEGICPEGCSDRDVMCDRNTSECIGCKKNRWGRQRCEGICPEGCSDRDVMCDRNTSECIECRSDRWGRRCENICHEGCLERNVTCDRNTSECFECRHGKWGNNCTNLCGEGCEQNNCHINGTCTCRPGWKSPMCETCNDGKWGQDCLNDCADGCQDGKCNKDDGSCNCKTSELVPPLCGGCVAGKWGQDCQNDCAAGCEAETCNKNDGSCKCLPGWEGSRCEGRPCECAEHKCTTEKKYVFADLPRKVNVALGKTVKASTTKPVKKDDPNFDGACLANDGQTSASNPTCMSTAEGDTNPFWQVDLGRQYVLAGIKIDWDDTMSTRSGIDVLLDDRHIYSTGIKTADPTYIPNNRRRNLTGQVVKLQRRAPNKDPLMICEVEVYNCRPGFYGHECESICERPVCENSQICSRIDGSCPKTVVVKETVDCSPLILVAGCFVAFLVIALCIFAEKVLPYKKTSGTKAVKKKSESSNLDKEANVEGTAGKEVESEEVKSEVESEEAKNEEVESEEAKNEEVESEEAKNEEVESEEAKNEEVESKEAKNEEAESEEAES